MVEIFKTNVEEKPEAYRVLSVLNEHFPSCRINFDLHDCDRILRIEGYDYCVEKVMLVVKEQGFECSLLED